jgi:formylmethanofuran dehydrogenase subunit E
MDNINMSSDDIKQMERKERKNAYHRKYYHEKYKEKLLKIAKDRTSDKVKCKICGNMVTKSYMEKHNKRKICFSKDEINKA